MARKKKAVRKTKKRKTATRERRPVTDKEKDQFKKLFLGNSNRKPMTLAQIGEKYDRRPQLVLKHLHAMGVTAASRKKKSTKKAAKKKKR